MHAVSLQDLLICYDLQHLLGPRWLRRRMRERAGEGDKAPGRRVFASQWICLRVHLIGTIGVFLCVQFGESLCSHLLISFWCVLRWPLCIRLRVHLLMSAYSYELMHLIATLGVFVRSIWYVFVFALVGQLLVCFALTFVYFDWSMTTKN